MRVWGTSEELEQLLTDFDNLKVNISSTVKYCQNLITRCISHDPTHPSLAPPHAPTLHFRLRYLTQMNSTLDTAMLEYGDRLRLALDLQLAGINVSGTLKRYSRLVATASPEASKQKGLVTNELACTIGNATFLQQQLSQPLVPSPPSILPAAHYRLPPDTEKAIASLISELVDKQTDVDSIWSGHAPGTLAPPPPAPSSVVTGVEEVRRWIAESGRSAVLSLSEWGLDQEKDRQNIARFAELESEHTSAERSVHVLLEASQVSDDIKMLKEEWSRYSVQFDLVRSLPACAASFYAALDPASSLLASCPPTSPAHPEPQCLQQLEHFLSTRSAVILRVAECRQSLQQLLSVAVESDAARTPLKVGVGGAEQLLRDLEDKLGFFDIEWRAVLRRAGVDPVDRICTQLRQVASSYDVISRELKSRVCVGSGKEELSEQTRDLSQCRSRMDELTQTSDTILRQSKELLASSGLMQLCEMSQIEQLADDASLARNEVVSLLREREHFLSNCIHFHSRQSSLLRDMDRLEQISSEQTAQTLPSEALAKLRKIRDSYLSEVEKLTDRTKTIAYFPPRETLHIHNMELEIEARLEQCEEKLHERANALRQDKEVLDFANKASPLNTWYLDSMGEFLLSMSCLPDTSEGLEEYRQEMTSFQEEYLLPREGEHEELQGTALSLSHTLSTGEMKSKLLELSHQLKKIHKKRTSHFNALQCLSKLAAEFLSSFDEVQELVSDLDTFCQSADASTLHTFLEYQSKFELSQSCVTKLSSLFEKFSSHPAASVTQGTALEINCSAAISTFRKLLNRVKLDFARVETDFLDCELSIQPPTPAPAPSVHPSNRDLELLRDVISQVEEEVLRVQRTLPFSLPDTQQALSSVTSSLTALSSISCSTLERDYPTPALNSLARSLLSRYRNSSDLAQRLASLLGKLLSFLSTAECARGETQGLLNQVGANKALPSSLRLERMELRLSQLQEDRACLVESLSVVLSGKQLTQSLAKLESVVSVALHLFKQLQTLIRSKTQGDGREIPTDQVDRFEIQVFQMVDSIRCEMEDIPQLDKVVERGLEAERVREELERVEKGEERLKELTKPVNHLMMTGNSIISTGHAKWLRVERLSEQMSDTLKEMRTQVDTTRQRLNLLLELLSSLAELRAWCESASQLTAPSTLRDPVPLYHKTEACINSAQLLLSQLETCLWLAQQIKVQQVTEVVLEIKVHSQSLLELLQTRRSELQLENLLPPVSLSPPIHTLQPSDTSQGDSSAPNTVIIRQSSSSSSSSTSSTSQDSRSSIGTVGQDYALKFIQYIIRDLLDTEAAYVEMLRQLVEVFLPYFSQSSLSPKSLEGQVPILFSNSQTLFSLHSSILSALSSSELDPEKVCHIFASRESEFWSYFTYIKRSYQSQKLIERHNAKVWQKVSQELNCTHPLQFYLLQPLQRIPKYQILLKDLLDYAIASHSPHAQALDSTLKLLHWIPTCADNALHWSFVSEGDSLPLEERDVLLQDVFYASCGFREEHAKEVRVFLTPDWFVVAGVSHKSGPKDMYVLRDAFKLCECLLTAGYVEISSKFRVSLLSKPEPKSYSLLARTPETKDKWVETMLRLLAEHHGFTPPVKDTPHKSMPPVQEMFEVSENFEPTGAGLYLRLVKGQKVRVLDKSQGDVWLVGVLGLNRVEGLVPVSHLREVPTHKPSWASSSVFSDSVYSLDPSLLLLACQHIHLSHIHSLLSDYSREDELPEVSEETHPFRSGDRVVVLDTEADATLWLVSRLLSPCELEAERQLPYLLLMKAPSSHSWSRGLTHNSDLSLSPMQERLKVPTLDSPLLESRPPLTSPSHSVEEADAEQEISDQQWERLKKQASTLPVPSPPASVHRTSVSSSSPPDTLMVSVLKDFESNEPDLLTAKEGTRLEILYTEGTGWIMCRSEEGEEGLVPDSCLELTSLQEPSSPPAVSHRGYFSQPLPSSSLPPLSLSPPPLSPISLPPTSHLHVKSYDSQDSSVPSDFPMLSHVKSFQTSDSGEYSAVINASDLTAMEKCGLVIDELVSSEQEYVQDLSYSLSHYTDPLSKSQLPRQLRSHCSDLFELLSRLYSFHRSIFLPVLRMCQSHPENLGECFVSQRESLRLYTDYIERKHIAEAPMREFSAQIEEIEREMPRKSKQTLSDYLIRPVQRIAKYPLTLQDVLKYSARADRHLPKIEAAIELTREILRRANTRIHYLMLEFEQKQCLGGDPLLSDTFLLQYGNKHALKERQLFLFPRVLLLTKKKQFPGGKESYYLKDFLQCSDYSEVRASEDHPNTIELTAGERLLLKCKCSHLHKLWLLSLKEQLNGPPLDVSALQSLTLVCRKGLFRMDSYARRRALSLNDPPRLRGENISDNKQTKTQTIATPKRPASQYQHAPGARTSLLAPRIVQLPSEHAFWIHKPLVITCRFASNPPPSLVQWTHGDTPISPESGDALLITTSHVSSKLRIDKCEFSHSGPYTCLVKNDVGEISKCTSVTIRGPPTRPSPPHPTKASQNSVKLRWVPPSFDGNSPLTSYTVESLTGDQDWGRPSEYSSSKTSVIIKNLSPKLSYQFRVTAANKFGSSEPSAPSLPLSLQESGEETPPLAPHPFNFSQEIGRGRFAVAFRCQLRDKNKEFIAKALRSSPENVKLAELEASLLQEVQHPHVVELLQSLELPEARVLVLELVSGAPLLDRILAEDFLTEAIAVRYTHQLLLVLSHIHKLAIAHNDLRPCNILTTDSEPPLIKLIDFSAAVRVDGMSPTTPPLSTEFTCPEALEELPVSGQGDMWTLGVLCYIILTGVSPFYAESHEFSHTALNILTCNYSLQESVFQDISQEAQDFIQQLLVLDSAVRLTASACIAHPWIREITQSSGQSPWPMPQLSTQSLHHLVTRLHAEDTMRATRDQFLVEKDGYVLTPVVTEFAPTLTTLGDVSAHLDSSCVLVFYTSGDPTPSLAWEHNSARLSEDSLHCSLLSQERQVVVSIRRVEPRHEGVYTCIATNSLGNASASVRLTVEGAPIAPRSPQAILITQKNALISWQGSVEKQEQISYNLERLEKDGVWEFLAENLETTAFVDYTLEGGRDYQYRVSSSSRQGVSCPSVPTPSLIVPGLRMKADEESEEVFQRRFELGEEVEAGRSASIKLCRDKTTQVQFVAKLIPITSRTQEDFKRETDIHKTLIHPRVVAYDSRFFTPSHYVLVLEHMPLGNLLQYLSDDMLLLDERLLVQIVAQLLEAVSYLGSLGVVHCNLEPESLLIDKNRNLKVSDFSLTRRSGEHVPASSLSVSARGFVAPEVLRGASVSQQSDIWSVGCLLLMLGSGAILSNSQTGHEAVVREKCQMLTQKLSSEGCNFVDRALAIDPVQRISAQAAVGHPWVLGDFELLSSSPLLSKDDLSDIIAERTYL